MAVLKYKSGNEIKTLGVTKSGVSVESGVYSVNGKTGDVTGLYDQNNPPPYPVRSVNGKTGDVSGLYSADNPPPETIKIARVTTEVYGEGYRHRFLKSSLPNLNSNLEAPDAILSVVNASSVPMVSSRFEYDGNYVTVELTLMNATPVTNSQVLTIFYR